MTPHLKEKDGKLTFHRTDSHQRLDNGESLPTLAKYLKAAQPLHRLILELKAQHPTPAKRKPSKKSLPWSKTWDWGTDGIYHLLPCMPPKNLSAWLGRHSVYYLDGNLSPKELKELGCAGPDYHYTVFRKHPEWIQECHDLGMKVNAGP